MRIAIFGGTGFVGFHLLKFLCEENIHVNALVRSGSEAKLWKNDNISCISGDIFSEASVLQTLEGCDHVIYSIGILEESYKDGSTFQSLQYEGLKKVVDNCSGRNIKKFILMSANGVDKNVTEYQKTKLSAEKYLQNSKFDHTIFRPSVIFGNPKGRMEFATQLNNEMIKLPIPAVNFFSSLNPKLNTVKMSPVHVDDVVSAIHVALASDKTHNKIYELGGPDDLSWIQIINTIMLATSKKKLVVPMPINIMKIFTKFFSWVPGLPVTYDQITMLEQGNTVSSVCLRELIGRELQSFNTKNLEYLSAK